MKMLVTLSTLYLLTLSSMVTASGGHGHGEDDHDAHKRSEEHTSELQSPA